MRMRSLGWAVLPQERDDRRLPSRIAGQRIRWKQYQDEAPSLELTKQWSALAPTANTAILLGPVSGNVICLDLDITDPDLSLQIQEIAEEILGLSPFRRVGKRPKMALFYRMDDGVILQNRAFYLMSADGAEKTDHMIEVQSRGKMMTAYGPHHETGQTFSWQDALPVRVGPDAAPLITEDQLQVFFDAVENVAPFYRHAGGGSGAATWAYVEAEGIDQPRLRSHGADAGWVEDGDGYVVDGREKYLWRLASLTARSNPAACGDDRGVEKVKRAVLAEATRTMRLDGKWSASYLQSEVSEKVRRACAGVASGDFSPVVREDTVMSTDDGVSATIGATKCRIAQADDQFIWIPRSGKALKVSIQQAQAGAAEALALKDDRSDIHARVIANTKASLDGFLADVRSGVRNGAIHVNAGPTGAGKTAHTLRAIIDDSDTIADDSLPADQRRGPIGFLMPTYQNIGEVRARALAMGLDPELDDAELEAAAAEIGLISEDSVESQLTELRNMAIGTSVRTMIYKGKIAVGCKFPERMKALTDADIGSSGMCKSTIKTSSGDREDVTCPHFATCEAILQKSRIASSHIVFMPRAFLTLNIVEELKTLRGVIADEAIWDMLAHTNFFPLTVLEKERKEPLPTKAEKEAGIDPAYMLVQRARICDLAIEAIGSREDPAIFIRSKHPNDALELVKIAKRVCSSAIQSGQTVIPGMSEHGFKARDASN